MKLVRLDLLAFGSLHGISLDLACAEPCLHLVYGANEAGKSTALRALQGLFYGIPENTPDAHRFKAGELRVGALLCDARGREQYVVRRKGRKHTLVARDGSALHGPDVSWISAGVSEAQFRSLFALGYDTLEEGADELLGAAGELGESLFTAGTGGVGAHSVLDELRKEADAIYRPRGRTQRLNEVLLAFEEAKRNVREQSIRAEAYTEQQRAITEAEAEVGRWQRERQQLTAERVRLERARRVVPLFARRAEYQRERAALGDVVLLPESAGEDRRRVVRAARDANLRIEHVQLELAKLEQTIDALPLDEVWLSPANATRLAELRDRLSQYRRAQRELPARRDALESAGVEVQAMLERLGLHAPEADTLEGLRISRPLEAKIREQARLGEALRRRCGELHRQLVAKRDLVMRQSRMLAQLRGAALPDLEVDEPADDPKAQIALPLSEPPPPLRLERTDEFERAFGELSQERLRNAGKQEDEEQALARATCDLEALAQAGEPPSESQLAAAREARHDLSADLREHLSKERIGKAKALLDRLDEQTEQVDSLGDRLRREAARVAEYSRLQATRAACERQLERLRERAAELEARERELSGRWLALCAAAGVSPRPPAAMRGFLAEYRAEAARLEQLDREAGALLRELEAEWAEYASWQAAWTELAAMLGNVRASSVVEVEAVLAGLHDAFARADASRRDAREIEALERECRQFEAELCEVAARLLPELAGLRTEALAEALLERHAAAVSGAEKRATLEQQRQARCAELAQAQAVRRDAELELDALVCAARVSDAAGLEPAEEAARRARSLDAALAQLHVELVA
ncbi:MAG TPA: AAA family ATPase, partial [Polyangiales bacterium]|nr:AAA family ATPase [Polyangiales bacterium]